MIRVRHIFTAYGLILVHTLGNAGALKDHQGFWMGDMKIPNGPTLKIAAEVFTRADGSAWASVASPDQGGYDIPVVSVKETGDSAELDIESAKLKITWTQGQARGVFSQGGEAIQFDMKPVAILPRKPRPQTPAGPFPYDEQILAIPSASGVTLAATLSLPKGKVAPNVIVLVHGSGPATRNLDMAGHQSFAVLADYLARKGIAVLRYDKRGIGRSTGSYSEHTTAQLIDDVHAAVKAMKNRKQFRRVGLVGLSEGPGLAAAVAARDPAAVDFIVSLAGIGLDGLTMMHLQDRTGAIANGASPPEVEQLMGYIRKYYDLLVAHDDPVQRIAAMKAMQQALPDTDRALIRKYKMDQGTLSLDWASKPFLKALLLSNPPQDWRRVRSPVLVLGGSLDHQVPATENVGGIVAALEQGGNRKVEAVILPSLNHLFQTAKTGKEEEYATIEETMAPLVMEKVAIFIKKQR